MTVFVQISDTHFGAWTGRDLLREELEQVRREAAQYTQRLQQLEARAAA